IRGFHVTGVQTCALPILSCLSLFGAGAQERDAALATGNDTLPATTKVKLDGIAAVIGDYVILESDIDKTLIDLRNQGASTQDIRSEERRVGKECRVSLVK